MKNFLRKISVHNQSFSEVRLATLRPSFIFGNKNPSQNVPVMRDTQGLKKGKFSPFKKISRRWILLLLIVVLAIIVILAAKSLSGRSTKIIPIAQSKTSYIGKSLEFPVTDENGKATDLKLVMNLTNAELTKNILIQGQPATARDTKIFLILNLEVSNSSQKNLTISPVSLIRLVDSSGKLYAPDVNNGDVTVEAISTKKTRVGFVIDEGATNFKIQVGKVDGPKELINIKF